MVRREQLLLHEEVVLLALRDAEGTVAAGSMYEYAIGGAILAELLLGGCIVVEEHRRKRKLVNVVGSQSFGELLVDECLERIRGAKRRADVSTWVQRFAGMRNLKGRVAGGLCRRGILRADEDKVLLIFSRKIYPEVDPGPERRLIERLREAIFSDRENIDARTVVLVSLAHHAGLLKVVFDKKSLRKRKKRIESIAAGDVAGEAAKEAIEAMMAAVMVASITPAIMAVTMNH